MISAKAFAVVRGDAKSFSIACASVVAKVTRDRLMERYDALYPQYGFGAHKGYGTRRHEAALRKHGPCEIHRRSFEPVKSCIKAVIRLPGDQEEGYRGTGISGKNS
ncbi:MAG: ribonuclease HII [Candidatus Omnitrophica bacterium]|nr:ribonuclease HII [Candidatus Omnitrophota bacterium]